MAYYEHFPYTNFHDINLDRMIDLMEQFRAELKDFVNLNTVKYADPFDWDITSQYPANTIVMDPSTGVAYISVRPVPAGAPITDTSYWTPVFDLTALFEGIKDSIAAVVEQSTSATVSSPAGTLIWVGNTLYEAQVAITAGDTYRPGGNVEHVTIEELLNRLKAEQTAQAQALDDETEARIEADAAEKAAREAADADLLLRVQHMKFPHAHATNHLNIFVAAATGNDSKDGLTEGNAIKTLKHAFEIMADNAAGVYIHLIERGDYDMGYPVISGCMLHLQGTRANGDAVDGVNVNWGWENANWTLAFYNCYIHLDHLTLNITQSMDGDKKRCYLEAGKLYAYKVTFNATSRQTFGIVGGAGQFEDCTFNVPVQVSGANVVFNGCKFNVPTENENETVMVHVYRSSTVTFINSPSYTTSITLPAATTLKNFLYLTSATMFLNLNLSGTVIGSTSVFEDGFAKFFTSALFGQYNYYHNIASVGAGTVFSNSTINGNYMQTTNDNYNAGTANAVIWNPSVNKASHCEMIGVSATVIIIIHNVAERNKIVSINQYNANLVDLATGEAFDGANWISITKEEANSTKFTITPRLSGVYGIIIPNCNLYYD